jgi:hypothetical protein
MRKAALLAGILLLANGESVAQERVRLEPKFAAGQTLVYQMDFRTVRDGGTEGVLEDPQAARHVETALSARVRLAVLSAVQAPGGGLREVRLRATYEKIAVRTESDVPDPQIGDRERELRRLEGRSLEFTLDAEGNVQNITGLEDALPEQSQAVREWLAQISLGGDYPREGIFLGQSWEREDRRPVSVPLEGYVRRIRSTYLRNEPCSAVSLEPGTTAARPGEVCAVILTRSELVRRRSPRDPTPEEYRHRGLRTAGVMSSSGETLSYISLHTGLLVSSTHSSSEQFDITISAATGNQRARYRTHSETTSQISLLALSAAEVRPD